MYKRSTHTSISVHPSDKEGAIAYYTKAFGLQVGEQSDTYTELVGSNFSICVSTSRKPGGIYQEFLPDEPSAAREHFESLGCKILEKTSFGFMVEDPYGLCFHVYLQKE